MLEWMGRSCDGIRLAAAQDLKPKQNVLFHSTSYKLLYKLQRSIGMEVLVLIGRCG
jgi:hypothetical protein